MALAEQRRKTKWSVDPNNSSWTKGWAAGVAMDSVLSLLPGAACSRGGCADKEKFGLKIMEKMGWSDGKGLGRDLHGSVSHIGVRMKKDNRGNVRFVARMSTCLFCGGL